MESQAQSLGCAVLVPYSAVPSVVLCLLIFTLTLIYESEICFKTFDYDKGLLSTAIGNLICSIPGGCIHDKCKQEVRGLYADVLFIIKIEGLMAFVKYDYLKLYLLLLVFSPCAFFLFVFLLISTRIHCSIFIQTCLYFLRTFFNLALHFQET